MTMNEIIGKILDFLMNVFLEASLESVYLIISGIMFIVGYWGIFVKAKIKGYWALIPCVKYAKLGKAVGMENEGRMLAIIRGILILTSFLDTFVPQIKNTFTDIFSLIVSIFMVVYEIRIYLSLLQVYGRSKWWIILWVVFDGPTALLFGWHPKFQPQWTVQEMEFDASNFFSGSKVAALDQGLTVNLEERTATEMFKKKYLLRDIHMYIQPGHMVLLLGGSGAGKTTYLNAINGYEKAKAEVVLNGRNMYKNYKDMQYDIGFVPQLDLMRGSDSVFNTLMDAATLRLPVSMTKAERQARVEDVMKIFGLTPVKNNLVVKLSGGQRKRLSIAMEFISNPTLFILDEPDSGLDGVMARELFTQLRQIANQGKIIIVITHTPDRVIDLFDDVIVLAKDANRTGRLAYFGSITDAREFFGKEKMEEIVKSINRQEEGGEGRADEFIMKFAEVQHV